jgi:hypothetical protein
LLTWTPRLLGLAIVLFFAAFAFDVAPSEPGAASAVLMHLIPAALVAVVVAAAWRAPMAGAIGFTGLALFYAVIARDRLDWVAVISGPLMITAVLFAASAVVRRHQLRTS